MSLTPTADSARPHTGTGARVCAGIDWAKDDHAICIVDADGEVLDRFMIAHTAAGLKRLIRKLLAAGATEVGIERGDGPVVEALLSAELVVLVIAPGQLKNLRSRYGSAGNKGDRYDAYVLADVVRTDRRRLRPLTRSIPATQALRSTVRARRDLVEHRVGIANQLRAHLHIVFPGLAGLFADIDSAISLAGVAPSTGQSGKTKAVTFRWSADSQLRDALCDFAGDSRHANPWAADLYKQARVRGHDHPHAVRILGRAWANIIWRCWQDGIAYDPDRHNALQRTLHQHTAKAA